VRGRDRARDTIVRHLRDLARLRLVERRVGRDHADRGVLPRPGERLETARPQQRPRVRERAPVGGAHAGDELSRRRVDDVADRVHRDERRHDQPVGQRDRRRAESAAHRAGEPGDLADGCPGAGPDVARRDRSLARRPRRAIAAVRARAHVRLAAHGQVEEHRGRHDRHLRDAGVEADALLLQVAHHAGGRVEPERAAAGQHQRVHPLHGVARIEEIGLARARRAAAHVRPGDRAAPGEHDRAAGRPLGEGVVTHLQPRHRSEAGIGLRQRGGGRFGHAVN